MNSVLRKILDTRTVTDRSTPYPLQYNMDPEEGELIQRVIANIEPTTTPLCAKMSETVPIREITVEGETG